MGKLKSVLKQIFTKNSDSGPRAVADPRKFCAVPDSTWRGRYGPNGIPISGMAAPTKRPGPRASPSKPRAHTRKSGSRKPRIPGGNASAAVQSPRRRKARPKVATSSRSPIKIVHRPDPRPTGLNNPYMAPGVACYSPPKAPSALGTSCLQPKASEFEEVFGYSFDLIRGNKALKVEEFPELRAPAVCIGRDSVGISGKSRTGAGGLGKPRAEPEGRKRSWEIRLPCFLKRFGIRIEILGQGEGERKG